MIINPANYKPGMGGCIEDKEFFLIEGIEHVKNMRLGDEAQTWVNSALFRYRGKYYVACNVLSFKPKFEKSGFDITHEECELGLYPE